MDNKNLQSDETLLLIRRINSLAQQPKASLTVLSRHIAEAIAQSTGYQFVGIMTREHKDEPEVILSGSSTTNRGVKLPPDLGLSRPLRVKLTHEWFNKPDNTSLIDLTLISDDAALELLNCTQSDIKRFKKLTGINAICIVKLISHQQIIGLLVVGFDAKANMLNSEDAELLDNLRENISAVLDNKMLYDENQHLKRQVNASNNKLTALDEAKDDFISMASHQLRTPLTSVKGNLSIVLDGDVGEISSQQFKMLNQAYASSQRMVYIISDLLNVSRLRTGKFIMNSIPVNLADMVDDEVSQLKQIASSRGVELIYEKPKNFPELLLDDTKTRQIVMNFVDNAIYYTPADGHISVALEDKPDSVELRVTDDGIGVPRDEQRHLFTKFYRANNARKARPDGTGLGLFMAKKIVIAQHGSIIFESAEGKGSTFGFILNKDKLAKQE